MAVNESLWRRILCWTGRHTRSRSKAHDDGTHLRSVCRYCRVPMKRTDRSWARSTDENA